MSDIDCYGLSQTQCNTNPNCFYCISQSTNQNFECQPPSASHPDIGICEKRYTSACLPISGTENNYQVDTRGPNRNLSNYLESSNFFEVTRNMSGNPGSNFEHILEHPTSCKPPIKRELSYEEMREAMGMRF